MGGLLDNFLSILVYPALLLVVGWKLNRSTKKSREQDSNDHAQVIAMIEENTALTNRAIGEFRGYRREHNAAHRRLESEMVEIRSRL